MKLAYVEILRDGKIWNICSTVKEAVTALMFIKQFAEETNLPVSQEERDSPWSVWVNGHEYTVRAVR